MRDYRAHIIMGNGRDEQVVTLDCADDVEALSAAQKLVDGHDVEVWCGFRKLGTLHAHSGTGPREGRADINVVPLTPINAGRSRQPSRSGNSQARDSQGQDSQARDSQAGASQSGVGRPGPSET